MDLAEHSCFMRRLQNQTESQQVKPNVGFWREGKTGAPGRNLSEQRREPTRSTQLWRRVRETNPSHIDGRRLFSPLHQRLLSPMHQQLLSPPHQPCSHHSTNDCSLKKKISFVSMLRSLSNLAAMGKIQKNILSKVRLVGLININTKE